MKETMVVLIVLASVIGVLGILHHLMERLPLNRARAEVAQRLRTFAECQFLHKFLPSTNNTELVASFDGSHPLHNLSGTALLMLEACAWLSEHKRDRRAMLWEIEPYLFETYFEGERCLCLAFTCRFVDIHPQHELFEEEQG